MNNCKSSFLFRLIRSDGCLLWRLTGPLATSLAGCHDGHDGHDDVAAALCGRPLQMWRGQSVRFVLYALWWWYRFGWLVGRR
jgi:hypothetical protein